MPYDAPSAVPTVPSLQITVTTGLEAIEMYKSQERTVAALDGGVWGAFARLVELSADPAEDLKAAEKSYKDKHTDDPNLPNPYRSAKSVALTAKGLGIALLDADGNPIGKSAVQKAIAAKKAEASSAASAAGAEDPEGEAKATAKDYVGAFVTAAHNLKRKAWANLTPEQRQQVTDTIDALLA